MGPRIRYGRKASRAVSSSSSAIFGRSISPPRLVPHTTDDGFNLTDLTARLDRVNLRNVAPLDPLPFPFSRTEPELSGERFYDSDTLTENSAAPSTASSLEDELAPITTAWKKDKGRSLPLLTWGEILGSADTLDKIAEASFAEVYRVHTSTGSNIIKVINLRVHSDPMSIRSDRSSVPEAVVSEIRIMSAMTRIPGYADFRGPRLVRGHPPAMLSEAYDKYMVENLGKSDFPNPSYYRPQSIFLVLELGDAGTVLEDLEIKSIDRVYDVLIGVTLALGRGELKRKFEVRQAPKNQATRPQDHPC
jgi:hypothetical protein